MILAVRAFCKALVSVAFGGRIGETARVSEELSAEHGEAVKRAELAEAHAAALAEEVERIRKWREDAPALVQALDPASELAALLRRAELAEARCSDLTEEVARLREWRGQGLAFELVRQDGKADGATVRAEIDYSGFAHLFGGDWAQRLRFAWFPDCSVLVLGEKGSCGDPVWLEVENDQVGQRLVVEVPIDRVVKSFERELVAPASPGFNRAEDTVLSESDPVEGSGGAEVVPVVPGPGSVLSAGVFGKSRPVFRFQSGGSGGGIGAISGGQSGTSGSFTATGLAAAGKWSVSGATGGFSYSYPVPVTPSPVGAAPSLSLGYSSAGVDGFTSSENTQGGYSGLGWEMAGLGFIERRYRACSTDGASAAAYASDMCWVGDSQGNATISLAGTSSELVATGANNLWRLKDDPFWKVQRCSSTSLCNGVSSAENGDDGDVADNEYWLVTTPDGVQYWFGYGEVKYQGAATNLKTNSVQYEPVYGNNRG